MKYILSSCLVVLVLLACNRAKVPRLGSDSARGGSAGGPVWAEELAKFQLQIRLNRIINNTIIVSGDTLLVNLQHHARRDAPFIIKGDFYDWADVDTLRAFPFESSVSLLRSDSTIVIDTLINKEMIASHLSLNRDLQSFGVLFSPGPIRSEGDYVVIPFYFSIPITDQGRQVSVKIRKDGEEIKVTE